MRWQCCQVNKRTTAFTVLDYNIACQLYRKKNLWERSRVAQLQCWTSTFVGFCKICSMSLKRSKVCYKRFKDWSLKDVVTLRLWQCNGESDGVNLATPHKEEQEGGEGSGLPFFSKHIFLLSRTSPWKHVWEHSAFLSCLKKPTRDYVGVV